MQKDVCFRVLDRGIGNIVDKNSVTSSSLQEAIMNTLRNKNLLQNIPLLYSSLRVAGNQVENSRMTL